MAEKHTFLRSEMVIGTEGLNKLKDAHVAVFGVGGVGSFTAEALCGPRTRACPLFVVWGRAIKWTLPGSS